MKTISDISPVHWQYGAIARLKKGEKKTDYYMMEIQQSFRIYRYGRNEKNHEIKKDLESEVIKFMKKKQ